MMNKRLLSLSDKSKKWVVYLGRYLPQLFYSLLAPITLFVVVSFISFKATIVLLLCINIYNNCHESCKEIVK